MATGFRKILEGLRLIPKAASTASEKGDLDVVTSSGKLNYHNGTSASAVVTEDHSATLTNKTIDGDNNTVQDLGLGSLKTVLADADKVIRRDVAGAVVSGNALPNSSSIVTIDSSDTLSNKILNSLRTVKSTPINTAGALALPSTGYALVSANINTIAAGSDGSVVILTNTSSGSILITNEFSGAGDGIRTGTGVPLSLFSNSSIVLIYNATAPGYWYVVGGVGGSSTFNSVGSDAAVVAYNAVYLDSNSDAQKLDATTDTTVEFVGVSLDAGGGSVRVQVAGEVDIPSALIEGGSFTVGKPVYASVSNPGKYQSTLPFTAGLWIVPVGVATTATKMAINGAGSSTAVKITSEVDPYVYANVTAVSANTTLTNANSIILATGGVSGITLTLPAPTAGKIFNIKKIDAGVGAITISAPSGTIDGFSSNIVGSQYESLTLTSDGSNFFII